MTEKTKSLLKRLHSDSKGVSLIELIVAILILAIIVLPLMKIFVSTAKMNQVNAKNAGASTVAQNVMEAIKVNGLDKTLTQLQTSGTTHVLGLDVDSVQDLTDPSEANVYEFDLLGLEEGQSKYKAYIKLDSNYKDKDDTDINSNIVSADTSAFDSDSMLFVYPRSTGQYYDENALKSFCEYNRDYVRDVNQEMDDAWQPGDPTPVYLSNASVTDIAKNVSREIKIIIENNIDPISNTRKGYLINSKIEYTLPSSAGFYSTDLTLTRDGYLSDKVMEKLTSIYLVYIPFPYLSESSFSASATPVSYDIITPGLLENQENFTLGIDAEVGSADKWKVTVENYADLVLDPGQNLELYIAVQGKQNAINAATGIQVSTNDDSACFIDVYSNGALSPTIGKAILKSQNNILKINPPGHYDRIVDVTVEVESTDEDGTPNGDAYIELKSSIKE